MRIVHLTDRLTDRGGAHRHLFAVTRALAERGHDVHVVAGQHDAIHEDVAATTRRLPGLEARSAQPLALDALLGRLDPDVVHVHTVMNPVALECARAWGALFTVQDHRCFCPARGKWTAAGERCRVALSRDACEACFDDPAYYEDVLARTRARLAAIRGATIIVLSEYMRAELVLAGLSPTDVHVVPPFVDFAEEDAAAEPDGPPCVLFVGRLVEAKGPLDAVEAWRRSGIGLPLAVAGTGPLRERVEAAGVNVLGWVPRRRLPALLRRARALLMTPRWQEPFGIAGLEALRFGVPVVAWDSGGIREWHPGPLAQWGDVDGVARALRHAVETRATAPARFDREDLMDRLEAIYAAAIRTRMAPALSSR